MVIIVLTQLSNCCVAHLPTGTPPGLAADQEILSWNVLVLVV